MSEFFGDPKGRKEKLLVFAHHKRVLDDLEDTLGKLKIHCIRIDGAVPVRYSGQDLMHANICSPKSFSSATLL